MKSLKKLIEVALPLDDINAAAAKEKFIRHGHPSTLHLWWARRPLAAARAVLFAQLVNDPGGERGWGAYKGQTKEDARKERERLFDILRELVKWESTDNEDVLEQAREEIRRSWRETCRMNNMPEDTPMPPLHDPFAGGGAIPLEAQRLGLKAIASDLNPVAVLINKAMIEIPPKFSGRAPVGPLPEGKNQTEMPKNWPAATGLAEDVRRYGAWMRAEAEKRIGHLYPDVDLPKDEGGGRATVIAWLWARTVESPNPALRGVHVPLVSSFWLSKKKGKEAFLEPLIDGNSYRFEVRKGKPKDRKAVDAGTKEGRGSNFRCILSGAPIDQEYVRRQATSDKLRTRLMAVVADGGRGRIYLPPVEEHERIAAEVGSSWRPEQPMPDNPRWFSPPLYGLPNFGDLFTNRQLVAINTFCDLVQEARHEVVASAVDAGWDDDGHGIEDGGTGATAYGEAIALYLAMGVSKLADAQSSLCRWKPSMDQTIATFGRQAIPMVWDYAESNVFSGYAGDIETTLTNMMRVIDRSTVYAPLPSSVLQKDAAKLSSQEARWYSTDPPYYDNIGYADLSDYFYVWLRRTLRDTFPDLLSTMLVPKAEELVATPYRHGGTEAAEQFFLNGMQQAMQRMADGADPAVPVTIYYAFKQSESGWETFLEAVLSAGFAISGTWPMRTEMSTKVSGLGKNMLASSVVLVCRPRPQDAATVTRRQFLHELREMMPDALEDMIGGKEGATPIAPVDLAQAAIGPGMAVYSQYAEVLEADGSRMPVGTALSYINEEVDRYFSEAEGEMDADTRFCVDWFQQYGFKPGAFGEADVLARAKGTSVEGLVEAGVLQSGSGKVRLLKTSEYPDTWDPVLDKRKPVWEACHQLARALGTSEAEAGRLLAGMPEMQEPVRQLAYRLYTLCERKGWAEEARIYNMLVGSWHGVIEQSHDVGRVGTQADLGL